MSDTVTISRNEYDHLRLVEENKNITISRSEYDYLKDKENKIALIRMFLDDRKYCEDELRMILGIEETEAVNG